MSYPTESRPTAGWWTWPALLGALFLLNASVTFDNVWPTPGIRWGDSLSIELAGALLILAAAHRRAAALSRRLLPGVWVVLMAGRYLDVTGQGLYGREFNLYWDAQYMGDVAAMLARAAPWWLIALSLLIVVALAAGSFALARLAFGLVAEATGRPGPRCLLGTVGAASITLFAGQLHGSLPAMAAFADPVTPAYFRQARFVLATFGPSAVRPDLAPSPALDADLGGLGGADVFLIFVESYGAITFDEPSMAAALARHRDDLERAVHETRRGIVSAYVESPTFGASSWLAHLTLLSGIAVRDQYAYSSLMSSDRETLVTSFARRGYRTVALMPGMRQPWPEGAFYGFDVIYGFDLLEYDGPHFGWWTIPDQYALAKLDALEGDRETRDPLFVVFPTSTTHAPFGPVAPYQSDWSRLLTAQPYAEAAVEASISLAPDLTDLRPSYLRAMAYEYRSLAGYLREHASDDLVMIAIGDHQPPAAVSGASASWDVPVHVIARDDRVLASLIARGFQTGVEPERPPIGGMHALVPRLIEAFDGSPDPWIEAQYDAPDGGGARGRGAGAATAAP